MGFKLSKWDDGLYILRDGAKFIFLFLHVDDGKCFANVADLLTRVCWDLEAIFELTWETEPDYYLGIVEHHNKEGGTVTLLQKPYFLTVLNKYGLPDCNLAHTPVAHDSVLNTPTPKEIHCGRNIPLGGLVGSLLYGASWTCPDISAPVGQITTFVSTPTEVSFQAGKHILWYIKGTINHGIVYRQDSSWLQIESQFSFTPSVLPSDNSLDPVSYSDANFGECLQTCRSIAGNVTLLAHGPVNWLSRHQQTVAGSMVHAEYYTVSETGGQVTFVHMLLGKLGFPQNGPTPLYGNNQGSLANAELSGSHWRLKNSDICYHYIKELIKHKAICVSYILTNDMLVDVMTKGLPRDAHEKCCQALGIQCVARGGVLRDD